MCLGVLRSSRKLRRAVPYGTASVRPGRWACAAVKLIPMFAGRWGGSHKQVSNVGRTDALAAQMLGVSRGYVGYALQLSKQDSKAFDDVWHERPPRVKSLDTQARTGWRPGGRSAPRETTNHPPRTDASSG